MQCIFEPCYNSTLNVQNAVQNFENHMFKIIAPDVLQCDNNNTIASSETKFFKENHIHSSTDLAREEELSCISNLIKNSLSNSSNNKNYYQATFLGSPLPSDNNSHALNVSGVPISIFEDAHDSLGNDLAWAGV